MNQDLARLAGIEYQSRFGDDFLLVFSPGRINLIGEHTDYNDGYVFPAAIDKGIYLAIGRSESYSEIVSLDKNGTYSFSVFADLIPQESNSWVNYLIGVVDQIRNRIELTEEFNVVFAGDIPIGAGLSSSAALENAIGFGLNELFNLKISKMDLLKMSQKAEHEFVGVRCGIMDQFASMMGERGKAIILDCRSLEYIHIPVELDDLVLLLFNSNVEHTLAGSEYNLRRQQCEEGVELLRNYYPEVNSLRDVHEWMLETHATKIDPVIFKRCRYVINENQRVLRFAELLAGKNFVRAGEILYQGHEGLKLEYVVSCDEIDFMIDYAKTAKGVLGSRMMGGGFGGCTINMVKKTSVKEFVNGLSEAYRSRWGIEMSPLQIEISDGVKRIS